MKIVLSVLVLLISLSVPGGVFAQPHISASEDIFFEHVLIELQKIKVPADSEFANIKSIDDIKALPENKKAVLFNLTNPRTGGQDSETSVPSPVSCFDYYTFGSVQVVLQPAVMGTVNGVPLTFTGTIENNNPYPVVDGRVYIKIFRITDDEGVNANGYTVVDQFYATESLTIPANSRKPLEFNWQVPTYAVSGEYEVAAFFVASERFNLLGLSFTDDVTGNKTNFSITSSEKEGVAFDKNAVLLNDTPYRFAAFPPKFLKEETVKVSTKIVNPTDKEQTVDIIWSLYNWAGERASNKIDQKNETIKLSPNEERVLTYNAQKSTGAVSYLRVSAESNQVRSILNIRFVREGINEARLNFPGITTYPLVAGQENKLFACFHATSDTVVPQGKVTTVLTDEAGSVIHSASYEGAIGGDMMALAESFIPKDTLTNFTLTTTLTNNNEVVDQVVQNYRCEDIDPTLCPKVNDVKTETPNTWSADSMWYFIIGVIVCSLVLLILFFRHRLHLKEKHLRQTFYSFAIFIVVGASVLVGGHSVEAKSINVNLPSQPRLFDYWNQNKPYPNQYTPSRSSNGRNGYSSALDIDSLVSINYRTNLVNNSSGLPIYDGEVVPVGTKIRVESSHVDTDISWFGTGNSFDSPYGTWRAGATEPPDYCSNYFANTFTFNAAWEVGYYVPFTYDVYIPLSINPPAKTITTSPNLSCTGNICTVTASGPITITNNFASTYGYYWYRYRGDGFDGAGCYPSVRKLATCSAVKYWPINTAYDCVGTATDYTLNIPTQSISFNFSAAVPGGVPTTPTIRGNAVMTIPAPVSGMVGTPATFHVQSTDPDDDSLRYGIDWDNNGSIDQWAPGAGYVASGVSQPASRIWGTPGTYIIRVRTEDRTANLSGWSSHTISICAVGEYWDGSACVAYPPRLLVCPSSGSSLLVGDTLQFEARYWASKAMLPNCVTTGYVVVTNSASWSSSNSTIASVTNSGNKGKVTALTNGGITISANYSGLSSNSPVTITVPVPSITLTTNYSIVRKGQNATLKWTVNPDPILGGSCTVKGPGVNLSGLTTSGSATATNIQNFSKYLMICTGAFGSVSDDATVEVVPSVFES